MNDLDEVGGFVDPIVDQDRSMDELTDAGPSVHGAAYVRETRQQIEVVQDGVAEPFGGGWEISPRVGQDFLKIR